MEETVGPSAKRIKLSETLAENEAATSIDQLPEEVLSAIFSFSKPQDKKQFMIVNKTWFDALQRLWVTHDLRFNLARSNSKEAYKVFIKTKRNIFNLIVKFEDLPGYVPDNRTTRETRTTKITQNVRILHVQGFWWHKGIKSLKNFPLLEKLILHDSSIIECLRDFPPNLKEICVKIAYYLTEDQVQIAMLNTQSLVKLTVNEMCITGYDRDFLYVPPELRDHSNVVFVGSRIDFKIVKVLRMEDFLINAFELKLNRREMYSLSYFHRLKEAKIYLDECKIPNSNCWFQHFEDASLLPNLEKVHFGLKYRAEPNCEDCMKYFALSAPKALEWTFCCNGMTNVTPALKFGKCFSTLNVQLKDYTPIQPLTLFEDFTSNCTERFCLLKVLILSPVQCTNPKDWNDWPEMQNLEELALKFYGDKNSKGNSVVGVENIATKCRQIRFFALQNKNHKLTCSQLNEFFKKWPFLITFATNGIIHDHKMAEAKGKTFTICKNLPNFKNNIFKECYNIHV